MFLRSARLFCIKEKAIYATLNLFEGNMNLRANCWYPQEDLNELPGSAQHEGRGFRTVLFGFPFCNRGWGKGGGRGERGGSRQQLTFQRLLAFGAFCQGMLGLQLFAN